MNGIVEKVIHRILGVERGNSKAFSCAQESNFNSYPQFIHKMWITLRKPGKTCGYQWINFPVNSWKKNHFMLDGLSLFLYNSMRMF
ncbi:MAG TPA: hypothetical protein DF613_03220, partial [Lachnospiraceae bacterium]|nr:hypothetical protein [Lachnospiraceae bacterium]